VLVILLTLQSCRESQNTDKAEVESLQSTIDELKNEISVRNHSVGIMPVNDSSVFFCVVNARLSKTYQLPNAVCYDLLTNALS